MSLQESYNLFETMSKRFKVGDNSKSVQKTASIVNNSTSEQNKDQLCASMISKFVKVAAERVKGKQQQQRTASITNKVDEVGSLKGFISNAGQFN